MTTEVPVAPPAGGTKLIAACASVHNRATITQRGLASLLAASLPPGYRIRLFVGDDKSSRCNPANAARPDADGRAARSVEGTGDLFWGGGMRLALEHAYRHHPDYVLWFNDDVQWDPSNTIDRMVLLAHSNPGDLP